MPSFTKHYVDLTGGVQNQSSRFLQKDNEVSVGNNTRVNEELGGLTRTPGNEKIAIFSTNKPVKSLISYIRKNGEERLFGTYNNSGDTNANFALDYGGVPLNILTDLPRDAKIYTEVYNDYLFLVGYSEATNTFYPMTSVFGLTTSTTDNVFGAPRGKYIMEYLDRLWVGNCYVDGKYYPSRAYFSSLPMDKITDVNGDFSGDINYLDVDQTYYLKSGMSIDIYKAGTETLLSTLTITDVNNSLGRIYFNRKVVTVSDNDEIYLSGAKGKLTLFWDTDHDYKDISTDSGEEIKGMAVNSNRLLFFKDDSIWKWDGAQQQLFANNVGLHSQDTIGQLSTWTLFYHETGVWGLSGNELKLLSRKIQPYIDAIKKSDNIVASVDGELYILWVGEPQELRQESTTTSTSSTSTSSTSSSTSTTTTGTTTSTSSTSSSTSISTSSTSTSSTSSSTSSTSISTSTSSTTTSTSTAVPSYSNSTRLVYDFANNVWDIDKVKRVCFATCQHKRHGITKLYFTDEIGRIYRDNVGTSDAGWAIPMEVEAKRYDFGYPNMLKQISKIYVYTNPGAEGTLAFSIDGEQYKSAGQITGGTTKIEFDGETQCQDISVKVMQSGTEQPLVLYGFTFVGKTIGELP